MFSEQIVPKLNTIRKYSNFQTPFLVPLAQLPASSSHFHILTLREFIQPHTWSTLSVVTPPKNKTKQIKKPADLTD